MSNFLDNLKEAVGENPLSAALIGGGALWLLFGNERLKSAAASVSAATARPLADIKTDIRSSAPESAHSPQSAREMDHGSLHDGHTEITSAASGAANAIKDRLGEGVIYARESFSKATEVLPPKETIAKVQSSISSLIEKQPLVLGAIGLAVGVAVASAFTTSDLENEWIGEVSDRVKEDLEARAGCVSHSVREASDTLKATFREVGSEAADRLQGDRPQQVGCSS